MNDLAYIYHVVREDNDGTLSVKIGYASDENSLRMSRLPEAIAHPKGMEKRGWTKAPTVHSIMLCPAGLTEERSIHNLFYEHLIPGCTEEFYIRGDVENWLDWLGCNHFAVDDVRDIDKCFLADDRFPSKRPWHMLKDDKQPNLNLQMTSLTPLSREKKIDFFIENHRDEWYTPGFLVDSVREVFGGKIDVDPASAPEVNALFIRASRILTARNHGEDSTWECADGSPSHVFCNPPYSGGDRVQGKFVRRAIQEYREGRVLECILVFNASATHCAWWQPLWDFPLCFTCHGSKKCPSGRILFLGNNGKQKKDEDDDKIGARNGTGIVYIGANVNTFKRVFSDYGVVVVKA